VLILEDGERVVGDIGGAIDLATIPGRSPRIEIVPGHRSSLYGSTRPAACVIGHGAAAFSTERAAARASKGEAIAGSSFREMARTAPETQWVALDLNLLAARWISRVSDLPDLQIQTRSRQMVGLRAGTDSTKRISPPRARANGSRSRRWASLRGHAGARPLF